MRELLTPAVWVYGDDARRAKAPALKSHGKKSEFVDRLVVPKAEAAQSVKGLWRPIVARLPLTRRLRSSAHNHVIQL